MKGFKQWNSGLRVSLGMLEWEKIIPPRAWSFRAPSDYRVVASFLNSTFSFEGTLVRHCSGDWSFTLFGVLGGYQFSALLWGSIALLTTMKMTAMKLKDGFAFMVMAIHIIARNN